MKGRLFSTENWTPAVAELETDPANGHALDKIRSPYGFNVPHLDHLLLSASS
ncbi:MAG: hypothetical protein KAV87_54025 [Desulfobacteraceae bacterium]|nr:hypothetical protein [Desulfobacteraceae bacterium]